MLYLDGTPDPDYRLPFYTHFLSSKQNNAPLDKEEYGVSQILEIELLTSVELSRIYRLTISEMNRVVKSLY